MKLSTSSKRIRTGASAAAKTSARARVPGGAVLAVTAQGLHAPFSADLAGQVEPGILVAVAGVPGVPHEGGDPNIVGHADPGVAQDFPDSLQVARFPARPGQVVEGGQRVGLAAPELGDQGEHRGAVLRPAG